MHQSLQGATFHLEHVVPRSQGGATELSNLALACPSCNLHKSDRIAIQLDGSNVTVPMFHPRRDFWSEHFDWEDYNVVSKSQVGHVTIVALILNHERRIKIRQAEQIFGLFPPELV